MTDARCGQLKGGVYSQFTLESFLFPLEKNVPTRMHKFALSRPEAFKTLSLILSLCVHVFRLLLPALRLPLILCVSLAGQCAALLYLVALYNCQVHTLSIARSFVCMARTFDRRPFRARAVPTLSRVLIGVCALRTVRGFCHIANNVFS